MKTRITSAILALTLMFSGGTKVLASAKIEQNAVPSAQISVTDENKSTLSKITLQISAGQIISTAIGTMAVSIFPRILEKIWDTGVSIYDKINKHFEVKKNEGFSEPKEIINRLEKIVDGTSEIRVYDQEKAKNQVFDALSGTIRVNSLNRGKNDAKEIRGNILYLSGPSGTGKTKMCYAIADALLNNAEKTSVFCHSESITGEAELGTQLFKTISTKDIGEKRTKNMFTGTDGLIAKDEESSMLKHLLKWPECVIIIDEYEKMKQKSAKPGTMLNINGMIIPNAAGMTGAPKVDNSADEILRSIASTGKYKFMNKEVDCSKVLFLITTNETREEIEKNFGIGGTEGGGAQRLNIIEFDYLSVDACHGIANDAAEEVTRILTDKGGPFKLKNINFDEESLENMANFIFEDKFMQGRAKYKLEDKIFSLFSKTIGKESDKNIKISFDGEVFVKAN